MKDNIAKHMKIKQCVKHASNIKSHYLQLNRHVFLPFKNFFSCRFQKKLKILKNKNLAKYI